MKIECKDLPYVLRHEAPELLQALEVHTEACALCREQFKIWKEISLAAGLLRQEWESPGLWPRIHQALATESQSSTSTRSWSSLMSRWQVPAAVLALILIAVSGVWVLMRNSETAPVTENRLDQRQPLLTEQALRDIESAEAAYIQSIERLSAVVEPRVQRASSPLLISYREKLMLIDAAISECRANIERNRFNAHLRQELLSVYREKQDTLQQVLREDKHELR
jgi:hypothetical protein